MAYNREKARARYLANREKILARNREWYQANRKKQLAYVKRWQRQNWDLTRDYRLKHRQKKRGLAEGETQKTGPCEICGGLAILQWDHNHQTGKRRGWLCRWCNMALGWVEGLEYKQLLDSAQEYLRKWA